jgi:hypothetical protein
MYLRNSMARRQLQSQHERKQQHKQTCGHTQGNKRKVTYIKSYLNANASSVQVKSYKGNYTVWCINNNNNNNNNNVTRILDKHLPAETDSW